MTAHVFNGNLDPLYPATLSKATLTDLLRNNLKFKGVIVSDDMQMKSIADHYGLETAIRLAIEAGVDILIFANNTTYDPAITSKAAAIIHSLLQKKSSHLNASTSHFNESSNSRNVILSKK